MRLFWYQAVTAEGAVLSGSGEHTDIAELVDSLAAQGIGVAFMHAHHFDDAQDPRLVRLFDFDVDSPYSYWFVCRPRALRQPAVKLFHDWLLAARI